MVRVDFLVVLYAVLISHFRLGGSILMDDIRRTLGMLCSYDALWLLIVVPVLIQQLASDTNKSRRAFNYCVASTADDG